MHMCVCVARDGVRSSHGVREECGKKHCGVVGCNAWQRTVHGVAEACVVRCRGVVWCEEARHCYHMFERCFK